jgi:hypothetical protein
MNKETGEINFHLTKSLKKMGDELYMPLPRGPIAAPMLSSWPCKCCHKRSEVLTLVNTKTAVFWDVTPCSPVLRGAFYSLQEFFN